MKKEKLTKMIKIDHFDCKLVKIDQNGQFLTKNWSPDPSGPGIPNSGRGQSAGPRARLCIAQGPKGPWMAPENRWTLESPESGSLDPDSGRFDLDALITRSWSSVQRSGTPDRLDRATARSLRVRTPVSVIRDTGSGPEPVRTDLPPSTLETRARRALGRADRLALALRVQGHES